MFRIGRRKGEHPEAIAHAVAKTVRDFEQYFGTLDHPKLEAWIEDTVREMTS